MGYASPLFAVIVVAGMALALYGSVRVTRAVVDALATRVARHGPEVPPTPPAGVEPNDFAARLVATEMRYEAMRSRARALGLAVDHCNGPVCGAFGCRCGCEGCARAGELYVQARTRTPG